MLSVAKFGGSSMADASQFKKIKDIVQQDSARKIVVVSAPGKINQNDNKITDLLYLCYAHLKYGISCHDTLAKVSNRYIQIRDVLQINVDIEYQFEKIKKQIEEGITQEFLVSRGEYLAALLMADYLGFEFIDSANWLRFDYDGKVNKEVSYELLASLVKDKKVVIPGFYGAYEDGTIHLLQRGGSDITGALAAAALGAQIYENWTDVSGVLMADPNLVNNPKSIKELTYEELREMSNAGAKVLHEETIAPVMELKIPLNIKNTNEPNNPGTMIRENHIDRKISKNDSYITSIAGRENYAIITCKKSNMKKIPKFRNKFSDILESYNLDLSYSIFSVDSISCIVDSQLLEKCRHQLIKKTNQLLSPDTIEITQDVCLITIVGKHINDNVMMYEKILKVLGEKKIFVKVIIVHPELHNLTIGVGKSDYKCSIDTLYRLEN